MRKIQYTWILLSTNLNQQKASDGKEPFQISSLIGAFIPKMSPYNSAFELIPNSLGFIGPLDFFWALHELWQKTNYKPSKPSLKVSPLECRQYSDYAARYTLDCSSCSFLACLFFLYFIMMEFVTIGA
jgi:hypothetical protein